MILIDRFLILERIGFVVAVFQIGKQVFDISSTFTCPKTSRLALAQALTLSMAALPIPLSRDRRSTFPSIAIT